MTSRTYATRAAYNTACDALATHLNTLTSTQVSEAFADGYIATGDWTGQRWSVASDALVEYEEGGLWFIEEHGASARYEGGRWVGREPTDELLTSQGLAVWGEDSDDFGYPI